MLEKIGKYEVSEQIGVGGFGAVYRGRDPFIKRTVAIKTCQVNDEEIKHRFFREAELAGNLHHKNITTIYDFGVENGIPYIVQEFLTGEDLDKKIKRGDPIPVSRKIEILMAIAEGLGYAHSASIIHRDVKPANVLFDAAGNAKLGDFGSAHLADFGQTQTGGFFGTVAYMSPEQITGAPIGYSADLYALGATLVEALTGKPPFFGPDLVAQHLGEAPPRPSGRRPGLSPLHDEVLMRALAKAPGERFASALEMAEAVVAWPAEATAGGVTTTATETPAATAAPAERSESTPTVERELWRTTDARLVLRHDARTAREVLVEEHASPIDNEALQELREVATAGGPQIQRLLRLDADRRAIWYEVVEGDPQPLEALTPAERAAVAAPLARLPAGRARAFVRTAAGPVVLVAPVPLSW